MSANNDKYQIHRKETCPWGEKAIELLKEINKEYTDHIFSSDQEVEDFKNKHDVKTTPQIFFKDERIGGYTDLAEKFDVKVEEEEESTSYTPIIAVIAVALSLSFAAGFELSKLMGYFLAILACLKLMNIEGFKMGFKKYDLITKKIPAYANVYPFLELAIGLLFIAKIYPSISGILSSIIGLIGFISIVKAVYIEKKDLNCACIGGDSGLPLGVVSVSENLAMIIMGVMVILKGF